MLPSLALNNEMLGGMAYIETLPIGLKKGLGAILFIYWDWGQIDQGSSQIISDAKSVSVC